ncbi:Hypothetical protein CINCED_3A018697 [Cinara cedri]|uniref:Uncharacterized protein n=1 Tax=Cinara cedri TaxID=506608 RepID=A0A5E4NGT0_9HEMI|nr:Hypothetical protein CINCED_3A018697 [Cinara cedri]
MQQADYGIVPKSKAVRVGRPTLAKHPDEMATKGKTSPAMIRYGEKEYLSDRRGDQGDWTM